MKALFLSLLLCVGAVANEYPTHYDEAIELMFSIPEGLKKTWNVSNTQTGFTLSIFNTDEEADDTYVVAIGKMPLLDQPEEEALDLAQGLLEEILHNFSSSENDYMFEEFRYHIEPLSPIMISELLSQRFRVHLFIEELEEVMRMDVHLLCKDGYACVIITGGLDCECADDLNDFSESVLENIAFIDDCFYDEGDLYP